MMRTVSELQSCVPHLVKGEAPGEFAVLRRLSQITAVDVARVSPIANKVEPHQGGGPFRSVCSRRECSR